MLEYITQYILWSYAITNEPKESLLEKRQNIMAS